MATNQVKIPALYLSERVFRQYGGSSGVMLAIARELIQNSYDAKSKLLAITASNNMFSAEDDGVGMNKEKTIEYFLQMNGSSKSYQDRKNDEGGINENVEL